MQKRAPFTLDDVFFHTSELKTNLSRLILDNNKNSSLVYTCNSFLQKTELIENIIRIYDNLNLKKIHNEVNKVIFDNPEIHCVNIVLKRDCFNSKFDYSKSVLIQYTI